MHKLEEAQWFVTSLDSGLDMLQEILTELRSVLQEYQTYLVDQYKTYEKSEGPL